MAIQYSRTISLFTVSGLAALKQEGREGDSDSHMNLFDK